MDKAGIAPGTVIGRWTVLDTYEKTSKGERKKALPMRVRY